jgi:hypothetical protein
MKDVVIVSINAPRKKVAALLSDPSKDPNWREDIAKYEPLSGKPGEPGSTYRLIPKRGGFLFTGTVLRRSLPNRLRITLESPTTTVEVRGTLTSLPGDRTQLVSEEVVSFKGVWSKTVGLLTRPSFRKTHRRNIEAFKKLAETVKQ